jgi:uncharacterized membrane protein YfcA
MLSIEFVGCFFCILIVMMANAGGLGGGGVVIPVGIAFYKFDTREAIAMSNASVFISSLVRFMLILKKKHPLKGFGVVVDYDIATLMLPSIIVGANLGVIANLIIPETIITVVFTLILFGLFIRSMLKGLDLYRQEQIKFAAVAKPGDIELKRGVSGISGFNRSRSLLDDRSPHSPMAYNEVPLDESSMFLRQRSNIRTVNFGKDGTPRTPRL